MGLASYGRPTYVRQIRDMIEEGPQGEYRLNLAYFSFLTADRMFSDFLTELLGHPPRTPDSGDHPVSHGCGGQHPIGARGGAPQ